MSEIVGNLKFKKLKSGKILMKNIETNEKMIVSGMQELRDISRSIYILITRIHYRKLRKEPKRGKFLDKDSN
jgi:hypothetical protein